VRTEPPIDGDDRLSGARGVVFDRGGDEALRVGSGAEAHPPHGAKSAPVEGPSYLAFFAAALTSLFAMASTSALERNSAAALVPFFR
jgi:hypothetical protein